MLLKRLVLVFALVLVSSPALKAEAGTSIEGLYGNVPGKRFQYDGKTVDVVEFLSFYCGHCYHFERAIPVIKGNFPKRIRWKVFPIYWGKGSPKPGEAYLIAEEAGRGEQMKKAIFDAFFIGRKDIGDVAVLESIAAKAGLGFDFSFKLRSGEKAKAASDALNMARVYGVNATPTLIIAGNIMTTPDMFNGDIDAFRDNTIRIIKSILKR